jgi:hypothetical protein
MFPIAAADRQAPGRKLHCIRQVSDGDVIDLLLKRGSDRYERVPTSLAGIEIVPARADPSASLALPAPVGMFLCFAHTRHQLAAADRERVAAAICSETAQQFVRSAVAQIKSFFGAPSVNPFIWKERQSLDLSELIHLLGMVNRTDELSLLPVLSDKKTFHPYGFGVFAIWLRPLPTNVQ